ncbi:hypothetical protein [Streptomyces sp. NPDC088196]|uniref:hypothetical protein n=1 Tax=Streptomyces sp. NPDC088196 TaxID=3154868 RepID=UPI00344CDE96
MDTGQIFTQEDGSLLHPGKVSDLFERLIYQSVLNDLARDAAEKVVQLVPHARRPLRW